MDVLVLGCGYVGCAMAERLLDDGHTVAGVRRSAAGRDAVEETGAIAVQADLTDPASLADVSSPDVLVIAASSGGGDALATRSLLVEGVREAIDFFGSRKHVPERVVYTSTTGVYGNWDGAWVNEATPLAPTAPKTAVLAEAELAVREGAHRIGASPIVARCGGIYGPGRYRIQSSLSRVTYPGYRNLIHRSDAAGALARLSVQGTGGHEIVNVVDDEPIERRDFVAWLADAVGEPAPPTGELDDLFDDPDRSVTSIRRLWESKRVSNGRLRELGYEFQYPTFREGYAPAVRDYRVDT